MLLGCCHCGEEPPSESIPPSESTPSESQSQSQSSGIPTTGACTDLCLSGIAPTRYLLTVSTTSILPCDALYVGTFLMHIGASGGACGWSTTQRAVRVNAAGCPEATTCTGANAPRYTLEMVTFASGRNIILRANAFLAVFGTCVTYWTGLAVQGGSNVSVRNCLAGASGTATIGAVVWTWSIAPA
jgi:hypothetical protein